MSGRTWGADSSWSYTGPMGRSFTGYDLTLARRTELAEAANGFAFSEGAPAGVIEAEAIAGGCAVFAGVGSPITHALGIGMNGPLDEAEFDRLEDFFRRRGSACLIDLCPMADPSVVDFVIKRGYKVIEFNNLMLKRLEPADAEYVEPPGIGVVLTKPEQRHEWCELVVRGFSGVLEMGEEVLKTIEAMPAIGVSYFGTWHGKSVGTASMTEAEGIAMLHGDATLSEARGKGIQTAMIRRRLAEASREGCEWAMACVIPGSASHRNYGRCGFELFYMRVNVMRELN